MRISFCRSTDMFQHPGTFYATCSQFCIPTKLLYIFSFLKIETFRHKQKSQTQRHIHRHETAALPRSQLPSTKPLLSHIFSHIASNLYFLPIYPSFHTQSIQLDKSYISLSTQSPFNLKQTPLVSKVPSQCLKNYRSKVQISAILPYLIKWKS